MYQLNAFRYLKITSAEVNCALGMTEHTKLQLLIDCIISSCEVCTSRYQQMEIHNHTFREKGRKLCYLQLVIISILTMYCYTCGTCSLIRAVLCRGAGNVTARQLN